MKTLTPIATCFWCETPGVMTIDHLVSRPLAAFLKTFKDVPEGILRRRGNVSACAGCNNKRSQISNAFSMSVSAARTSNEKRHRRTRKFIRQIMKKIEHMETLIPAKLDRDTAGYLLIEINVIREFYHGRQT